MAPNVGDQARKGCHRMHVDNESQSIFREYRYIENNNCELDDQMNKMQDMNQQIAEEEVLSQVTGGIENIALGVVLVGSSAVIGALGGSVVGDHTPNGRNAAIGAASGAALGSVGATVVLRQGGARLGALSSIHGAIGDGIELVTRR
jgi:hypothetical protein